MPRRGRTYDDDDEYVGQAKSKKTSRNDVESGRNTSSSEDDDFLFGKRERKNFVAKVYFHLTIQLIITFVMIFGANYSEVAREFMLDYFWVVFVFMVVQLILYCVIVCSESVRRNYPLNFILLTFHTLCFAVMATWISAYYNILVIWLAFLSTAAITISVSIIAKFSPWDVTGCGMFIMIGFLAVMLFSLIAFIVNLFMHAPILFTVISGICVVLLSFYLMFITQMILGGRKGEMDPEEVVYAVIILYVTIIDIFLHLLRLITACMGDSD